MLVFMTHIRNALTVAFFTDQHFFDIVSHADVLEVLFSPAALYSEVPAM